MKIYAAQLNPTVGDLSGNAAKIRAAYREGVRLGADLVALPEMMLTGYLPNDLLLSVDFLSAAEKEARALAAETTADTALLLPTCWRHEDTPALHPAYGLADKPLAYNVALFCAQGRILQIHGKEDLFNYSVADEKRVFAPLSAHEPTLWKGVSLGFPICRDLWYATVCRTLVEKGADLLISPNGSPYFYGKDASRTQLVYERGIENNVPILYLNLVGGQDEYVFDGRSFAMNPHLQEPVARMQAWQEDAQLLRFSENKWHLDEGENAAMLPELSMEEDLYQAMCLGLKDYAAKNGFKKAVLGLSGGVDSALVAVLAADVFGAENVHCLLLPSPHSSEHSLTDAYALAENLGVSTSTLPLSEAMTAVDITWQSAFSQSAQGIAAQNIQSRLRGLLVMTYSNETGALALTTGNKSEIAVGYSTLYGDMCGGYNPLKDLYKTLVYDVCHFINHERHGLIPEHILTKAPSAELAPDQKDTDSLPDYSILDAILMECVERNRWDSAAIARATNCPPEIVQDVLKKVQRNEYKRQQAAPGPKLTKVAFGVDRRYPMTNGFKPL